LYGQWRVHAEKRINSSSGGVLVILSNLFMMLLSLLLYSESFWRIDKTARFFIIGGVAILGPFAVLTTPPG